MASWFDGNDVTRIERKLDLVLSLLRMVLTLEGAFEMATQETLDKLTADVAANTSASQSAALALTGFVKTVADLTDQLKAALASAGVDDPTVLAAALALEQNTATLAAATPAVAKAVAAGTPAA